MRTAFARILGVSIAAFASSAAIASPLSEAQQRYKDERAACMNGTSNQDRATCLKEAGAALAEAKRGGLASGDLRRNRVARCTTLPAQERADCELRMEAGTTSGSSQSGGILREVTQTVPTR